jgi:hypothetical protein
MTRFALRLPQRQARLVALAVAYHLARPASELAGEATMLRRQLPLARAREVLEGERRAAQEKRGHRRRPWQFWKR